MGTVSSGVRVLHSVVRGQFSSGEIREKMILKVRSVLAKLEDRAGRISKLMQENRITDAAFAEMVVTYMRAQKNGQSVKYYSNRSGAPATSEASSEDLIPAGVISNLITERELIESERVEVEQMELILRSLKDIEKTYCPTTGVVREREVLHRLTDDEIRYLGL